MFLSKPTCWIRWASLVSGVFKKVQCFLESCSGQTSNLQSFNDWTIPGTEVENHPADGRLYHLKSLLRDRLSSENIECRLRYWVDVFYYISSYIIRGLWSGGMVDRGSDITSSKRDFERADTLFNVAVGFLSRVGMTVNKLIRVQLPSSYANTSYLSLRMISALTANRDKISVIVLTLLSTRATSSSWRWGENWEEIEFKLFSGGGRARRRDDIAGTCESLRAQVGP